MRALSGTLIAAQQAAAVEPHVEVTLHDADIGVPRLRWSCWYTGVEPDGPCAAAVSSSGALLRARVAPSTGGLSYQRVVSPGASSDYSAWSALGTVASAPRIGLAAAGGRVLIASVRSDGVTVEVRESADDGVTLGGSSALVVAGATVSAIGCGLRADGGAAVLYASGGVVRAITRAGLGAWSAPVAWTHSLAAVSGIAVRAPADYEVVVSGTRTDGSAGCWATMLGTGSAAPPGGWLSLTPLAVASAGTGVTYVATGIALADVARAAFVEAYSGSGAYQRVQIASGVAGTAFSELLWREPQPFEYGSAYGATLVSAGTRVWLCAPGAVWHAAYSLTETALTDDVIALDMAQERWDGRVRLTLRNDHARYSGADAPLALAAGGELHIAPGYRTAAGLESAPGPVFWIDRVRRRSAGGVAVVEIEASDGWGVLEAWTAPRQVTVGAGTMNVFQLVSEIARRVGLHVGSSGGSAEIGVLLPAFTLRAGERGRAAVRRLLEMVPDVITMQGLTPLLTEPLSTQSSTYAYGAAHAVQAVTVESGRPGVGWARVFGSGVFAEAVDGAVLRVGGSAAVVIDDRVSSTTRAAVRASTTLRRAALVVPVGTLRALPHVGQEVHDVIAVTDAGAGLVDAPFRVAAVRLRYERAPRSRYEMEIELSSV